MKAWLHFWNGSQPIGYRVVTAETRNAKVEKKQETDPLHANTVRPIHRLVMMQESYRSNMRIYAMMSSFLPKQDLDARRPATRPFQREPSEA